MNRRDFLKASGALVTTSALSPVLAGKGISPPDWSAAWRSVSQTRFAPLPMTITGTLPSALKGTLYRNGPALSQRGDQTTRHWFDGDGMIQRFSFGENSIVHDGNMVATARFIQEQEAGRFLYNHAGTHLESARPARNNDTTNPANIALMPFEDELLALWEGGSAYRVDPDSLDTLGRKDWRDDLVNMPFSAHPLTERDGSIWNFGFAPYAGPTGRLFVYHLAPGSGVTRIQPVTLPFAGYVHDFAQTANHLIFVFPPLVFKHGHGKTYVDSFAWQPEQGARLLVMDKGDLTKQRWFDLPTGFVFHFGNARQVGNELIVNLSWYRDASLFQSTREERIALQHMPLHKQAFAATIVANLHTGKSELSVSDTVLEFPGFAGRGTKMGQKHIGVGVVEKAGRRADTLTIWDPDSGASSHYVYPEHTVAEEPLLVSSTPTGAPYIVQTYFDLVAGQTGLNVFHSQHINDGPLVRASMDRALPVGFHGVFI